MHRSYPSCALTVPRLGEVGFHPKGTHGLPRLGAATTGLLVADLQRLLAALDRLDVVATAAVAGTRFFIGTAGSLTLLDAVVRLP